ncbi:hypothetical protein [Bradyrhizobium sp.]|uniref:hypothetical protein n=1 Tax=Bradyrhizobium sp. TaxID=376 RepID=UPI0026126B74|nr:hypothetical protein [Bradyrhizobium sp.]
MISDRKRGDLARAVSRHILAYGLYSISELLRHYDFDPVDLLLVHAVMNANVAAIMKDPALDRRFASLEASEPDSFKKGISRAALARFLNLPFETVRRRVARLKKRAILFERTDGLIVTQGNEFRFGDNRLLQRTNVILLSRLLRDLARVGVRKAEDL